jgi:hypothetical protein
LPGTINLSFECKLFVHHWSAKGRLNNELFA